MEHHGALKEWIPPCIGFHTLVAFVSNRHEVSKGHVSTSFAIAKYFHFVTLGQQSGILWPSHTQEVASHCAECKGQGTGTSWNLKKVQDGTGIMIAPFLNFSPTTTVLQSPLGESA